MGTKLEKGATLSPDDRATILFRAQHEALIAVLGRKAGAQLIKEMTRLLSREYERAGVFELGVPSTREERASAQEAAIWYRENMAVFTSILLTR